MNQGPAPSAATTRELLKMTADDYLQRTQATMLLEDAVTLILENRPVQPLVFLAKHFKMLSGECSAVETSAHYVMACTRPANPAFDDNLVLAYQALLGKEQEHVSLVAFQRVLEIVNHELPPNHAVRLVAHLVNVVSAAGVTYPRFKEAMELCIYYDALLAQAEDLFLAIDTGNTGQIKSSALQSAIELAQAKKESANVAILLKVRDGLEATKATITLSSFLDLVLDVVYNA
ncbi:hypothetical protein ACHHYP_09526 [Achlya hypogyna]|uniref:RIIa domain-containing protein n=1 Tax=Achlya hypogyna TaxID=1202772 RepID=A0A1V9YN06_ACHHY|nr:hypothetical protein ACHHYP_09526 [Achlya hypogyna]